MSTIPGDKSPQSPLKPSFVHWQSEMCLAHLAVRNEADMGSEVVREW